MSLIEPFSRRALPTLPVRDHDDAVDQLRRALREAAHDSRDDREAPVRLSREQTESLIELLEKR